MWLVWSQCCHCNVCLPTALGGGEKWSAPSSPLSAASVYQWHHSFCPPPPFLLSLSLSLLLQSIHFPIFFLRCPDLIYPFYLPPVFGAISPLFRLSLILVSPGFLSPGEEGERFQEETSSLRRSLMTHTCTQMHSTARLMATWHLVFKRDSYFWCVSVAHSDDPIQTLDRGCECTRPNSTSDNHPLVCHHQHAKRVFVQFNLVTAHLCVIRSNSEWPRLPESAGLCLRADMPVYLPPTDSIHSTTTYLSTSA